MPSAALRHRAAAELAQRGRRLFEQAELGARWATEPLDLVPLVRSAVYQIVGALLILEGQPSQSYSQCRERLAASPAVREPLGDALDDLGWLDERVEGGDPLLPACDAARAARFERLLARIPALSRRVERHLRARARADGLRPGARRGVGVAAVLLGALAALTIPYLLASAAPPTGPGSPAEAKARVTQSPPEPREVLDDPGRCFEATYYATTDFQRPVATRRDCAIEFDWGMGPVGHIAALPVDACSVRWRGQLEVPATDTYTFFLASDDGSRLRLDGELIIDNWGPHALEERASAPIQLQAGAAYPIEVDYFEAGYAAAVQLSWRSSTIEKRTLSGRFVAPSRSPAVGPAGAVKSEAP